MTTEAGAVRVGRDELARLTGAKLVANVGARWVPFFLPTLTTAFSATTRQLTVVLGVAELAGLAALPAGRQLDRGRERPTIVLALGLTAVGAALALTGRFAAFAVGTVLTILGVALCTVAGHTYLSRRVAFHRRARVLALFETSWALSLLIGAPVAAVLITLVGWRGPYVAIGVAAVVLMVVVARGRSVTPLLPDVDGAAPGGRLGPTAWIAIAASSAIGVTGLTTIVIAGTWLDEDLGVSTGGVGLVAMAFGVAELAASSTSAAVADRVGPNRATRLALVITIVGLVVMTRAGGSLPVGASGLALFFLGFEFAIVTSFALVSEAVPGARGRVLATNVAVGTVLRGLGVMASGGLYDAAGIAGPAGLAMVSGVVAIVLLSVLARR